MRIAAFFILIWLLSPMAASGEPSPFLEPYRVGVLCWSMNIAGQVAMRRGLEAEAARINAAADTDGGRKVKLLIEVAGDGTAGIERQIVQMEKMIRDKVDLLIVQPTDNAALAGPLREANRAGLPVIAYDQYISGGRMDSFVSSDNYQAGFLDGEYLNSLFPADRELRLILVEYPHVSSTVERVNGFLDALRERQRRFKIVKTYVAVEPRGGREAGQAILRDFPARNAVDAVFCVNDGGGLAVAEVLAAAGRDDLVMATVDGDPRAIRVIRDGGIIRVDAVQFCRDIGREAMVLAWRRLNRERIPEHVLIPVFPVTRETLRHYPPDGSMPRPIDKPWPSSSPRWDAKLKIARW